MSKRIKTALAVTIPVVLIVSVVIYVVCMPLSFSDMEITVRDFDYKPAFYSHIAQYTPASYENYKNEDIAFPDTDSNMNDYCLITVNAAAHCIAPFNVGVRSLYPDEENDIIVLNIIPVRTQVIEAGKDGNCSTEFLCVKNGMNNEELAEKMKEIRYSAELEYNFFRQTSRTQPVKCR